MKGYYFLSQRLAFLKIQILIFQTSEFIQGCDGAQSTGVYRGIHYKMKRYTRKVMKAIKKINRRRLATETNKDD